MEQQEVCYKRKSFKFRPGSALQSSLQARMTISYVWMTVATVLVVEIIVGIVLFLLITYGSVLDSDHLEQARQVARIYALSAAVQANRVTLDPHTTFMPHQSSSLTIAEDQASRNAIGAPYIKTGSSAEQNTVFALLIRPDGYVLASSYPQRYPSLTPVAQILPSQSQLIHDALQGNSESHITVTTQGRAACAAETVWSREKKPIGAVYVQVPPALSSMSFATIFMQVLFKSSLLWLLITVLAGTLFGMLTTRGLIRRLHRLITATTEFANGTYTQQIPVTSKDELGQLELQFTRTAQQLVESMAQRQALAEQNARLAERNRIARDLHDSVKQQVFAVSMQIGAALSLLEYKQKAAQQHMEQADQLAYQVQQELTSLIQELRPSVLRDQGLCSAIKEYSALWMRQHTISVELSLACKAALPLTLEEALFRIVQEALSNVARHSHATRVQIALTYEQEQMILSVADNGDGFDPATIKENCIGLHSMKERMEVFGGSITIESKLGMGTLIVARCLCKISQVLSDKVAGENKE